MASPVARVLATLRKVYGPTFAARQPGSAKLGDVLEHLNETSLSQLVKNGVRKGIQKRKLQKRTELLAAP